MSRDELRHKLNRLLDSSFSLGEEYVASLDEEATLESLNVDSLDEIEMVMALEEELGMEIPDNRLSGVDTMGKMLDLLEELTDG